MGTPSARSDDARVAELVERLVRTRDFSEACSVVLDRVVTRGGFDRAVVVACVRGRHRTVGWGVSDAELRTLLEEGGETGSALAFLLGRSEPELITQAGRAILPQFSAFLVLPFGSRDDDACGVLLLEADRLDERALEVHAVFERCGPALVRCLELELLDERVRRLDRQVDLITGILNGLADPVLLCDDQNSVLLSNRRAEYLFSTGDGDSEGRRQAVQINNLLFSSFLTQAVIGAGSTIGRELNLVDPSDGSDLMFEALSAPLPEPVAAEGAVITILRDITDLKRAVGELEVQFKRSRLAEHRASRERDQLNVVLENVGDPILVTDSRAKIILMNREAERLFESPAEAGGAGGAGASATVVRANDTKFTTVISSFLLQEAGRWTETLELEDPDTGGLIPIEVVSSKIYDERGEPVAIVSVLHDLTQVVENERLARELQQLNDGLEERIARATEELEARNRRLEWQSRELERASRAKSEFLANMSHELRTPLNVLIGYTSLLRDGLYGELNADQIEALEKVRTSSRHLLELINDILDLSKIEAGKMPVVVEEVRLEGVIEEIAESAAPLVREKSLELVVDIAPDLPVLHTDRTKVRQILLNLVSNAVKFTEEGTVRIGVAAAGDRVHITVADTGIGIEPEHLEMIFEDFHQLDQSTTKRHGGTGLGLSITRKLVALLGGVIRVESEYGRGSTFVVDLPLVTDARGHDPARRALLDALARVERMGASREA